MTHGSLESGIGCFDLAAEIIGWENRFHVEKNKFCQRILKYYWPDAESYGDLFEFDGSPYRGAIDIITCGFPCQPFSLAGKGKGDKDDRFIWPENMRVIKQVQPPFALAENVPGLLRKHPLVFERVCLDLETEGYEVQPFLLPAAGVNAPHRRDRIWFVAHTTNGDDRGTERKVHRENGRQNKKLLSASSSTSNGLCEEGYATNATGFRWIQSVDRDQSEFCNKDVEVRNASYSDSERTQGGG